MGVAASERPVEGKVEKNKDKPSLILQIPSTVFLKFI